jgi:peroxiredoxin
MKLLKSVASLATVLSAVTTVHGIEVGDSIPDDVKLHFGFPPVKIDVAQRIAGKNVILVGLPGAFTPT